MSALSAQLARLTTGAVRAADDTDRTGYDRDRSGFNLALDHRPDLVLAAQTRDDVIAGIRFAIDRGLPVDLQATGHGAHRAMDSGLLVATRRLNHVAVEPGKRLARVEAGATAAEVIAATAVHGLAAPVGSAPGVGYVSYSLGGGIGPFGRNHGYGADSVRALHVVTARGREITVDAESEPELFWALRGGGGNVAAVTALDVALFPATHIHGGGLFFDGSATDDAFHAFLSCAAAAPPSLSLSIAFVTFPDRPTLPAPLRGRSCCHVRVAHHGEAATGDRLIAPLRAASPFLDTVRTLPVTDLGTIHSDPPGPMPVRTHSAALTSAADLTGVPALLDAPLPFVLELRQLGGALAQQPEIADAVGHRDAGWNLFTSAYPGVDAAEVADAQQRVYGALAPFGAGGPLRTFLPGRFSDASSCYESATAARLGHAKAEWDPDDLFRFAPAVGAG